MVYDRHHPKGPNDTSRKGGQVSFHTHGDKLDDLLMVVSDKVVKLTNGESDPKVKARLIEIATNNLDLYFRNGGATGRSIKGKDGNLVTAAELQKQLSKYQK